MTDENFQPQETQESIVSNDTTTQTIDFFALPKEEKQKLQNEWIDNNIPEEDRKDFKENGYTPPELFWGKDRYGNDVAAKSPEEFKRDIIEPRKRKNINELDQTKQTLSIVQKELEQMKEMMKFQATSSIESRERDIQTKIEQARYEGDFDTYDRLKLEQFELSKRKNEFTTPVQPVQPTQHQFSNEEIRAIEDFRHSNEDFSATLRNSAAIRETFDDFVKVTAKNSKLAASEILKIAKNMTENVYPEIASKQKPTTFMNNQYSVQNSSTIIKKTDPNRPIYKYETLDYFSKKLVDGSLSQYPGKTRQEVIDIISSTFGKK